MESIVLGGGCFWCTEAAYQLVNGVTKVLPGYAGGQGEQPNYYSIHDNQSGWAEVIKVDFDTKVISLEDILDIFWVIHDPTTPNQQGPDHGPEYRSLILYSDQKQKEVAEKSLAEAQKVWDKPIVTEVKQLDKFYEAEAEHHNFFQSHPEVAYCQVIINPKLQKLQAKFASKLKPQS